MLGNGDERVYEMSEGVTHNEETMRAAKVENGRGLMDSQHVMPEKEAMRKCW